MTGLFETEREHPHHERVVLVFGRPRREHAGDAVSQARRVPREEVDLMTDGKCEDVTGIQIRDLLQQLATAEHVTPEPSRHGREVAQFPVVKAGPVHIAQPRTEALACRRHIVRLCPEHSEISPEGAPHREVGLDLERSGRLDPDFGAEVQQRGDRGVEMADGFFGPSQRHALAIERHLCTSCFVPFVLLCSTTRPGVQACPGDRAARAAHDDTGALGPEEVM